MNKPGVKIKAGVLGATGYTGVELLRLLVGHPSVDTIWVCSEKFAGKHLSAVFPHLSTYTDLICNSVSELDGLKCPDVVFSCLPHRTSMHFVAKMLGRGAKVIDFSADFRFGDGDLYKEWYGVDHKHMDLLKDAVYGLPELYREEIKDTHLVANPGCYATGAVLGLVPIASIMDHSTPVVIDALSAISGAGRAPVLAQHYPEANEAISPTDQFPHNQTPEIEVQLDTLSGNSNRVIFMPHTVPINRGILTTIYVGLEQQISKEELNSIYEEYYKDERFVRVAGPGTYPRVEFTKSTNFLDVGVTIFEGRAIIVVAHDNLGKGASGQALQNMNIMFGLPEDTGLTNPGVYP